MTECKTETTPGKAPRTGTAARRVRQPRSLIPSQGSEIQGHVGRTAAEATPFTFLLEGRSLTSPLSRVQAFLG